MILLRIQNKYEYGFGSGSKSRRPSCPEPNNLLTLHGYILKVCFTVVELQKIAMLIYKKYNQDTTVCSVFTLTKSWIRFRIKITDPDPEYQSKTVPNGKVLNFVFV